MMPQYEKFNLQLQQVTQPTRQNGLTKEQNSPLSPLSFERTNAARYSPAFHKLTRPKTRFVMCVDVQLPK